MSINTDIANKQSKLKQNYAKMLDFTVLKPFVNLDHKSFLKADSTRQK